jgi:WD40 repeat protein
MQQRAVRFLLLSSAILSHSLSGQDPYPFSPANYIRDEDQALKIFPLVGEVISVPLPFRLGRSAFSPDGRSINTARGKLSKIEFGPVRVSAVLGTEGFDVSGLAISKNDEKVLISGARTQGDSKNCGMFEIKSVDATVRKVISSGCDYTTAWTELSLSPSGERAVARHNGRIEIIDIARGATTPLDSAYEAAEWSPDGKWIAVLGGRGSTFWLVDPANLASRRDLGTGGGVHWSPDSRYLLSFTDRGFDPYTSSMETLEVATGTKSEVKSSHCQIVGGVSGWIRTEIAAH